MAQEVSIPRSRIADGSLPPVCFICGNAAVHRRFARIGAPSLAWLIISPLIGLLVFWVSVLSKDPPVREGTPSAGIPFCDRHRNYWPRRGWFIVGGFGLLLVLFVISGIIAKYPETLRRFEFIIAMTACSLMLFLIAFVIVQLSSARPTGGNATVLELTGAHEAFARALKQPPP